MVTRCFLPAVEMNPRTLFACQSVAFIISASGAPLARAIISKIFAPLLSARGAAAFLAAFLLAFASLLEAFVGAVALALAPSSAPLAGLLALGAPFFRLEAFLAGAFSGATCA